MQRDGCNAAGSLALLTVVRDASAMCNVARCSPGLHWLPRTELRGLARSTPLSSLPALLLQHPQPTEIGQPGATWQRGVRIQNELDLGTVAAEQPGEVCREVEPNFPACNEPVPGRTDRGTDTGAAAIQEPL